MATLHGRQTQLVHVQIVAGTAESILRRKRGLRGGLSFGSNRSSPPSNVLENTLYNLVERSPGLPPTRPSDTIKNASLHMT